MDDAKWLDKLKSLPADKKSLVCDLIDFLCSTDEDTKDDERLLYPGTSEPDKISYIVETEEMKKFVY